MKYCRYMREAIPKFMKRKTNLSESTKRIYSSHLMEFDWWLKLNHHKWTEIDDDVLITFLDEHTGWSESTRYNAAVAIKSFYRWQFGDDHPVLSVHVRRHDPGPQRTLDWKALEKLLSSINTSTAKGVRDLSLVTLMVDTGLRASEICRADLKFLNREERTIEVMIKGGSWGTAAFFDYADSCLHSWLAIRDMYAKPEVTTIYCSIGGTKPGTPLTKDGLRSVFRVFGAKAALGLISPHDLRRTFATLATKAGAPSRVVQIAGRWSSIKMVERYTKVLDPADMQEYSPVNKLMGME